MSRFATPIRNQNLTSFSEKAYQPKLPVQNKPGYRICSSNSSSDQSSSHGVSILGGSGHILEILKDGDLKTIKSSESMTSTDYSTTKLAMKKKILKESSIKIEKEDRSKQIKPRLQSQIRRHTVSPKHNNNLVQSSVITNDDDDDSMIKSSVAVGSRMRSRSVSSIRSNNNKFSNPTLTPSVTIMRTPSPITIIRSSDRQAHNTTSPILNVYSKSSEERAKLLSQIFPSPDSFHLPWKYKLPIKDSPDCPIQTTLSQQHLQSHRNNLSYSKQQQQQQPSNISPIITTLSAAIATVSNSMDNNIGEVVNHTGDDDVDGTAGVFVNEENRKLSEELCMDSNKIFNENNNNPRINSSINNYYYHHHHHQQQQQHRKSIERVTSILSQSIISKIGQTATSLPSSSSVISPKTPSVISSKPTTTTTTVTSLVNPKELEDFILELTL